MDYRWTKDEIALTRHAWRMYDAHVEARLMRRSWYVAVAAVALIWGVYAICGY